MQLEESRTLVRVGAVVGYLFSYALCTTVLFFVLQFSDRLPAAWSYLHVAGIVAVIALVGEMVRRMLR